MQEFWQMQNIFGVTNEVSHKSRGECKNNQNAGRSNMTRSGELDPNKLQEEIVSNDHGIRISKWSRGAHTRAREKQMCHYYY